MSGILFYQSTRGKLGPKSGDLIYAPWEELAGWLLEYSFFMSEVNESF